jgi:hypothetical protein
VASRLMCSIRRIWQKDSATSATSLATLLGIVLIIRKGKGKGGKVAAVSDVRSEDVMSEEEGF